ncbi:MAG: hypothetical protein JRM72_06995 [Nitrososphaerota archaeon]|nr:hypothetical protein [Nitrososphaerota archaeon]MDG7043110.1 hypothetical protein [Nitrososphaerota archaeon]
MTDVINGQVKQRVLKYCKEPKAFIQIHKESGIAQSSLAKSLNELKRDGYLVKDKKDGLYCLTNKGKDALENLEAIANLNLGMELRKILFILEDKYDYIKQRMPNISFGSKPFDQNILDRLGSIISKYREYLLRDYLPVYLVKRSASQIKQDNEEPMAQRIARIEVMPDNPVYEFITNSIEIIKELDTCNYSPQNTMI